MKKTIYWNLLVLILLSSCVPPEQEEPIIVTPNLPTTPTPDPDPEPDPDPVPVPQKPSDPVVSRVSSSYSNSLSIAVKVNANNEYQDILLTDKNITPSINDSGWVPFDSSKTYTFSNFISNQEGLKDVYVHVKNSEGGISNSKSSFTYDVTAPTAPTITRTSPLLSPNLELSFKVGANNDYHSILLSESSSWPQEIAIGWFAFNSATTYNYNTFLNSDDGTKTVYVFVSDLAGNMAKSEVSFTYDGSGPNAPTVTRTSSSVSKNLSISVDIAGNNEITEILLKDSAQTPSLSSSSWVSFNNSTSITYTEFYNTSDGQKTVYVFARDAAGNISNASQSFTYDTTAPSAPTVTRTSSATSKDLSIAISVSGSNDSTKVLVSDSSQTPSLSNNGWINFNGSANFTYTNFSNTSDGQKTVYVFVRDSAGNISSSSANFTYDSTAPSAPTLTRTSPMTSDQLSISFTISANNQISHIYFSESSSKPNESASGWVNFNSQTTYTFTSFSDTSNGQKRIYVFAKDSVGNVGSSSSLNFVYEASTPDPHPDPGLSMNFTPRGVGGGGAMSGVSISPYSDLWFVGTDMGTLFRSTDNGVNWNPINHFQAVFNSDLTLAAYVGFSSDGTTVFHAAGGRSPKRSVDAGQNFSNMNLSLQSGEYIRYWSSDSNDANRIYAATTKGLLRSTDKGLSWSRVASLSGESLGTFIDHNPNGNTIYHANSDAIYKSTDYGATFSVFYNPSAYQIRKFTGGRDSNGVKLALIDNDGTNACSWIYTYAASWGQNSVDKTVNNCGYVWTGNAQASFTKTNQAAGDHIKMAENDSSTIYVTGSKDWIRQYGTKIHVSRNGGSSWTLKLNQIDWDVIPYAPWPSSKIEYSPVAIDVGWWDSGYESFDVNRRNSAVTAGTGYFFLHSSYNHGDNWKAPFTEFADTGDRTQTGKKWRSGGVEVITVYRTKFHPSNPDLVYAATADIGGLISDDHGDTFRISKAQYNSNFDYAFDVDDDNIVFAASGNEHDWPASWHANPTTSAGGIYRSANRGKSWSRITPNNTQFNRQFLSVAYDSINNVIYGGSHSIGIARSSDGGSSWQYYNSGLPTSGSLIIPQIEVDPVNGNVYALLTGDAPNFTNQALTGVYFLDVAHGATTWQLLRSTVHYPPDADGGYKVWYYPTAFAVDWSDPNRNTLWLVDIENNRNWLMSGAWKTTDGGANWHRRQQMTHAYSVAIDPNDSQNVHISGSYTMSGDWGKGGQYYTTNGGDSWTKDLAPPLQANARSVTIDPVNPARLFYSYFGGAILEGPNPTQSN